MKKNSLFKAVFLWLVFMAGISCQDALDTQPGFLTKETYYANENDYLRVIIGAYGKMIDLYSFNNNTPIGHMWLLPGDDVTIGDNIRTISNMNPVPFETFRGINSSAVEFSFSYRTFYEMIKRTNLVLEALAEKGKLLPTDAFDRLRGEALFLRAWAFLQLWNYYGTAPLITSPLMDLNRTETPGTQGLELIDRSIADFDTSSDLLPLEWPAQFTGRPTKNSAYGYLVKALCTRACSKKELDDEAGSAADYTRAIQMADAISGRSLVSNYGDNFSGLAENNPESLFELQASQDPSFENVWLNNDFGYASATAGTCYCNFDPNSGASVIYWACTPFMPTQKLIEALENDPRKPYIISEAGDFSFLFNTGYMFVKYIRDANDATVFPSTSSSNNRRFLRLADVKLLKAEALLQTGKPAEAIAEINDIRERAWGSDLANRNIQETNVDVIMDWIMDERFIELAAEEGTRWLDLVRWQRAGYIDLRNWGPGVDGFSSYRPADDFEFTSWYDAHGKEMIFPIPSAEILSNSLIFQNTGY